MPKSDSALDLLGVSPRILPVDTSRQLVKALRDVNGRVDYREFDGADHSLLKVHRREVLNGILDWVEGLGR